LSPADPAGNAVRPVKPADLGGRDATPSDLGRHKAADRLAEGGERLIGDPAREGGEVHGEERLRIQDPQNLPDRMLPRLGARAHLHDIPSDAPWTEGDGIPHTHTDRPSKRLGDTIGQGAVGDRGREVHQDLSALSGVEAH
jgi:hypothetical protein